MISSTLSSQFILTSPTSSLSVWQRGLLSFSALCRVKTRYLLTRDNRLRLRYVASAVAGVSLVMGLYIGGGINPTQPSDAEVSSFVSQLEPASGVSAAAPIFSYVLNSPSSYGLDQHRDASGQIRRDPSVKESVQLAERSEEAQSPAAEEHHLEIGKGDTLAGVLVSAGLASSEAQDVVNEVSRHFNMRSLRQGQAIDFTLEPADTSTGYELSSLTFSPDPLRTISVSRADDGRLTADLDEKEVRMSHEARKVEIDGSVYGSADRANLPDRVTANAIKLFSYAVDFQRDIQQGDSLEVLYDSYKTKDGYVARTGDIAFARLKVGGKEYALYRYETSGGQVDYYTADGRSIRKSSGLMRTPIAFGRMSSGFGMRSHPVLGYTKMHKGVDFAAPTGTPIYASGDGVIERAGRFSSFGNYVRVRHSSKISTAYAHMSRFGKGIRPGIRVKQGQIIGYVGTTGRSTGPHLHYEVLVNNVQVSPRSVKYAADNALGGRELARFKEKIRALGQEYTNNMTKGVKLASAE